MRRVVCHLLFVRKMLEPFVEDVLQTNNEQLLSCLFYDGKDRDSYHDHDRLSPKSPNILWCISRKKTHLAIWNRTAKNETFLQRLPAGSTPHRILGPGSQSHHKKDQCRSPCSSRHHRSCTLGCCSHQRNLPARTRTNTESKGICSAIHTVRLLSIPYRALEYMGLPSTFSRCKRHQNGSLK